jgi:hypothetical protein
MEAAVQRAFQRAGHETFLFDDRKTKRAVGRGVTQWLARRAARQFSPDFIFLSKCLALDLDTVAKITDGIPNAMWYHDPQWHRDTDRPDIGHITSVGRLAKTFFVTGFEDEWRAHGLNARFLPAAGASEIHPVAPRAALASDLAFIGTGYDPVRAEFLIALNEHIPVRVFGPGWEKWSRQLQWNGGPVEGNEFAAVCSSARIVLGVNPARAVGATNYASDRMWMTILGGAFFMGRRTNGIDRFLYEGEHCAWYDDFDSCLALARRYLTNEDERRRVQTSGEAWVRAHHTYDQRVPLLLSGTSYVPEPFTPAERDGTRTLAECEDISSAAPVARPTLGGLAT